MLYSELMKSSALDLCLSLGKSIEIDIKQKHLKKRDVAKEAGITEVTLHRICTGQNVKLESVISVLKVINRYYALQGMVTPSPVEPMSLYDDMVKERNKRQKNQSKKIVASYSSSGVMQINSEKPQKTVTAADIRRMCE